MQKHRLWGAMAAVAVALVGCGGGGPKRQAATYLKDMTGSQVSEVTAEHHPTIAAELTGLPPGRAVELMLYRDGQPVYRDAQGHPQAIIATADAQGKIPTVVLFYDLGVDPLTGLPTPAAGNYVVRAAGYGVDLLIPLTVTGRKRTRQSSPPLVWALRAGGRFAMGSVPEGEAVYATGLNFPPNRPVRFYIVPDKSGWSAGDTLEDVTGAIEETVTDAKGNFNAAVLVWNSAQPVEDKRDFDLVADVADAAGSFDNRFTPGTDAIEADLMTGFTVQSPPFPGRVALASDQERNYRTKFDPTETVSIWVNPPWRPLTPYMMVKKYICLHQDTWQFGTPLVDVTGRPEWDLVRYACGNQYLYVVWAPTLTPGLYDPIIDVNQNDVYDEEDIVGQPFEVRGRRPSRLFVSARSPLLNPGESTVITALVVDERDRPLTHVPVQFRATDSGSSVSPTTAPTNAQGLATTTLRTGNVSGIIVTVEASVQADGTTIRGTTEVQVRALGSLNAIVR